MMLIFVDTNSKNYFTCNVFSAIGLSVGVGDFDGTKMSENEEETN